MNINTEGRQECQSTANTSPSFFKKEWDAISKGFQEVTGLLKTPRGEVKNEAEVKKFCDCVKITAVATMITFAVAFVFSGLIGVFFSGLGSILSYDAYKVADKLQLIVDKKSFYPEWKEIAKNTILAKPLIGFLSSYFEQKKLEAQNSERIEENNESKNQQKTQEETIRFD